MNELYHMLSHIVGICGEKHGSVIEFILGGGNVLLQQLLFIIKTYVKIFMSLFR